MLAFWSHFRDEHALPEDFTVQCSDCPARFLHTDLLSDHCKSEHVNQNETFNTINPAKKRKTSVAKKEASKQGNLLKGIDNKTSRRFRFLEQLTVYKATK